MQELGTTKNRLRNLLRYTDELLSFNEKITFDLAREPYPHFHEFEVAGLAFARLLRQRFIRTSRIGSRLGRIRRRISRRRLSRNAVSASQSKTFPILSKRDFFRIPETSYDR